MVEVKLPVIIVIAIVSALAGGTISYVAIPNTDPELKALLARQVELAEEEAAARKDAQDKARSFFNSNPDDYPTSGGQKMAPRFGTN